MKKASLSTHSSRHPIRRTKNEPKYFVAFAIIEKVDHHGRFFVRGVHYARMQTSFDSQKLDWCKDELRALLERLIAGNYHQTAEVIFDHIAHTGVETDLNPELKKRPTLDEFMQSDQPKKSS